MEGASNNWIARRAVDIIEQVSPSTMVIMWSFLHRRESSDSTLNDEERRLDFDVFQTDEDDVNNLINCCDKVLDASTNKTNVIFSIIPNVVFSRLDAGWNNFKDESWPSNAPVTWKEFDSLDLYIQQEIQSMHKEWYRMFLQIQYMQKNFPLLDSIIDIEQKDLARDGFHFDIQHSTELVKHILPLL